MPWQRAAAKPDAEPPDAAQLRDAAVRLLAQREHSRYQLEQKLKRKFGVGLDSAVLAEVLRELAADGLQSDERFAEAKCRQRVTAGYGPLKIRVDLQQANVDPAVVSSVLSEATPDWLALAEAAAQRRFSLPLVEPSEQQRCARFLKARGFAEADIRIVLFD